MRFTSALLCVMSLLFCSFAVDAADKAKATPAKCQTACPDLYEPICGGPPGATAASSVKPVTFGSTCVLNKYKCESGKSDFVVLHKGECEGKAAVRLS